MPPRIYKGSEYSLNYPSARPFVYAGAGSISANFVPFSVEVFAVNGELNISFKNFGFECFGANDSLVVSSSPFTVELLSNAGGTASFAISMPTMSAIISSGSIELEADVLAFSATGVCYQISNITADVSALKVSANGTIAGTIVVTPPVDVPSTGDELSEVLSGNNYIVVNLHTKSHTTYRDGSNLAVARTGELDFSSQQLKNLSDVYLHARVSGDIELAVKSGEDTLRTYPVTFEDTTQPNLKNKKIQLAKGIRATTWQLSVVSPSSSHAEVRSADLIVNESKRRV